MWLDSSKNRWTEKLVSSRLFFPSSARGFTAGALDSARPSHCFDIEPASPLTAAPLQPDLPPFQSLSASVGLQSRLWPSRLNGMHGELWHRSCVEVVVAGEKSALTWEDLCVCGRLLGREARPAAASRFFFFEFLQPTLSLWHSPLYGLGRFNSFNQSFSVILFIHCTTGVKCLQGCTLAGMLKLITLFVYLCSILGGPMSGLCMRISIGRSCFERKIQ